MHIEPRSTVMPKYSGKKFEGGELITVDENVAAHLQCEAPGFPPPLFRQEEFSHSFTMLSPLKGICKLNTST